MKIPHMTPGESLCIFWNEKERIFGATEHIDQLIRQQSTLLNRRLATATEKHLHDAIDKGEGWNVWRGGPYFEDGDPGFSARYEFKLIAPGSDEVLEQPGVLFVQPPLTEGERARLLAGRHDWQEDRWEDYCGVPGCGHDCCEGRFTVI